MNYFKIKALSNSTLFGAFNAVHKKPAQLHVGSALDAAITAPENFDLQNSCYYDEANEAWVTLTPAQIGQVLSMKYKFEANKDFMLIRSRASSQDYAVGWFEPSTGTFHKDGAPGRWRIKGKPDFNISAVGRLYDLKSTACDSVEEFMPKIALYNYDSQGVIYCELFDASRMSFLCVCKKRAGTFHYTLKRDSIEYKNGLDKLCKINYNLFPEYSFEAISSTLSGT